jgi:hypothetical protein
VGFEKTYGTGNLIGIILAFVVAVGTLIVLGMLLFGILLVIAAAVIYVGLIIAGRV